MVYNYGDKQLEKDRPGFRELPGRIGTRWTAKSHGKEECFILYLFATGESRTRVHCSMGWSLRMLHGTASLLPIPFSLPFLMLQGKRKTLPTEK